MIRQRPASRRISDAQVSRLIIHKGGEKGLKAADLAAQVGITVDDLFGRVGGKLWYLPRTCMFTVTIQGRTTPVFTQGGVMMVCAWLGDAHALEIGWEIARLMKQRKRSSANRAAPTRRAGCTRQSAAYRQSFTRLTLEMNKVLAWPTSK
jgi:hypothetical protein